MLYPFSGAGRFVNRQWHEGRNRRKQTARSADEFGPIETERFDLDEFDGETGDTVLIDGIDNPDSYTLDPYGPTEQYDYRDDPRFD